MDAVSRSTGVSLCNVGLHVLVLEYVYCVVFI